MQTRIHTLLHRSDISIREQLFRLILIVSLSISLLAILAGLALRNIFINSIPLFILLAVVIITSVITFQFHKVELAAVLFCVLVNCGVFPMVFFFSGGIHGGAAVWFVLGIMTIFLMFCGKKLFFFLTLAMVADITTYIAAFCQPERVFMFGSRSEVYFDSLFAVLTVGVAVGIVMRFQTRLYELERELTIRQKDKIEAISRSKDTFFTSMSHEIRTPINTIIGLNEMILREDISDEVAEDALHIKNAGRILLSLVNDILDLSQLESGRMVLVPVRYRTKQLFADIVDLLQVRMKEKELAFYIDIDSSLPSVLLGDEGRIRQIVVNLLTNAVKYTQKGSVTLAVHGETASESEDRVKLTISVSDTGIGIKKEDMDSLYHSYRRIDREKNWQIEGSGLGLSITRQLVELMGGKINVDSIYTKGSVFTVILDQQIADRTPAGRMDDLEIQRNRGRSYYKQSFEAPDAKILVVDDNAENLLVTEKLLRGTKVQVEKAKSGEECLACTRQKIYHVILLDGMMPGMDGIETLKEIRRQEKELCRRTPVIAMTACASAGDEQKYMECGFDGYLTKPVDAVLLESEVLKFLPEELLEYRMNAEERSQEVAKAQFILKRKRKKIQISTDSACDLSKDFVERYDLRVMYLYVETEKGIFRDTKEMDSDNLVRHLSGRDSRAQAVSVPVEEYESFYAEALTEAEELIHISLASYAGSTYQHAVAAAAGFDHVHVIDAGNVSCGEGLLVLAAAHLLERGCRGVEELCRELEQLKNLIETGFLIPDIRGYYAGGYMGHMAAVLCRRFMLYPQVRMHRGGMRVSGFRIGKPEYAQKRFIRQFLRRKHRIDPSIVVITHAGCTLKQQKAFTDEVLKCIPFEKVIVQKASVSCASNSGPGTMGLACLIRKKENEIVEYNWMGDQ